MDAMNRLWTAAIDRLGPQLPGLLGALLILLAAWIGARVVRRVVERLVQRSGLDRRVAMPELGVLLGKVAHGLVWLLALPALLDALGLQSLLQPLNAMLARLLGVLPNLLGAAAILGVGVLVARVLRQVVTSALVAVGLDRVSERMGLAADADRLSLSKIGGSVVFVLVLLPTAAAAFQALGLEILADPVVRMLQQVLDLVPRLLAAAVILAIGVVLGRLLASLVTAGLTSAGVHEWPDRLGLGAHRRLAGRDLAELGGGVVMIGALLLSIVQALEVIGFPALTQAAQSLGGLLANLLVALVVLGVGVWLSTLAARAVQGAAPSRAPWVARAVQGAVLVFSVALALRQAGLPADIVVLAFGALVCSLGLGAAIALGFGGRDVARHLLMRAARLEERDLARSGSSPGDAP